MSYARKPFVLAILGFILGFAFFRIHYGHSLHWILDQWAGLRAAVKLVVLELRHYFTSWHVAPRLLNYITESQLVGFYRIQPPILALLHGINKSIFQSLRSRNPKILALPIFLDEGSYFFRVFS